MNILVYSVAADSGGALSVLMDFYKQFKEKKQNHYYFVVSTPRIEECDNITVLRFPEIKKGWGHRLLFEYIKAPQLVKKYNIDKVFTTTNTIIPFVNKEQVLFLQQCLPFIEYRFSWRESKILWIYQNLIGYLIIKSVKKANKVIVQTNWMKRVVACITKENVNKFHIKKTSIDSNMVKKFSGFQDVPIFFYPAGAFPYKNHILILKACKKLSEQYIFNYKVYFTLTGMENEYAKTLKNYVKKYNLPVEFIGIITRENVFNIYSRSVLLFPSFVETVGLPLIEAKAAGCQILAVNMAFSREILAQYPNAYLFDKEDWKNLAKKMESIILKSEC